MCIIQKLLCRGKCENVRQQQKEKWQALADNKILSKQVELLKSTVKRLEVENALLRAENDTSFFAKRG